MSAVEIKDMLVGDACEQQRQNGVLPTPRECEVMICGVLESMDQKPKAAPVQASEKKPGAADAELSKRRAAHGLSDMAAIPHRVERKPIAKGGHWFEFGKIMSTAEKRMRARLQLLRSKPDWRAKIERVNPLCLQGQFGKEKQKAAEAAIREVINASNAIFGHWMKEPAKPLVFA